MSLKLSNSRTFLPQKELKPRVGIDTRRRQSGPALLREGLTAPNHVLSHKASILGKLL